jgi:hypothetical protein
MHVHQIHTLYARISDSGKIWYKARFLLIGYIKLLKFIPKLMNICGHSEKITMASPFRVMYEELPYPPDESRIGSVKSSRDMMQNFCSSFASPEPKGNSLIKGN